MEARRKPKEIVMSTTQVLDPALAASPPTRRRTLRSIGAVLAGLVSTFIVTTAVDVALQTARVFPSFGSRMPDWLFLLALAYRVIFNIGGSWIAARLAPARPLGHALALGAAGVVVATVGAVTMGSFGPVWYSLANIAVALPCAWAGGRL